MFWLTYGHSLQFFAYLRYILERSMSIIEERVASNKTFQRKFTEMLHSIKIEQVMRKRKSKLLQHLGYLLTLFLSDTARIQFVERVFPSLQIEQKLKIAQ